MPSTHKTDFLELNRWISEDKPRMEDFNTDNQRTDAGVAALNTAITAHTAAATPHMSVGDRFALEAAGEHTRTTPPHLSAQDRSNLTTAHSHVSATPPHLSTQDRTNLNAAHTHVSTTAPHISAQERANIAAAVSHIAAEAIHLTAGQRDRIAASLRWQVHTYAGNGALNRDIDIGYRPLFGIVCALGVPMFETNMFDSTLRQHTAIFTRHGSSLHVTLNNNGISVRNSPNGDHLGNAVALNLTNTTYVIIAARDD